MSPNRFSFDFILKDKLETKWTFWICKSLPLSEILDNYLLIFFWFQLFLLTFWNSNYICIWTFCPTFTKLWSSLKYLFFSVFQIQYFLCSVFKFSDSSVPCRPPVTLDGIFFSYIVFSILKSDLSEYHSTKVTTRLTRGFPYVKSCRICDSFTI